MHKKSPPFLTGFPVIILKNLISAAYLPHLPLLFLQLDFLQEHLQSSSLHSHLPSLQQSLQSQSLHLSQSASLVSAFAEGQQPLATLL
jgi:hypothetical protein